MHNCSSVRCILSRYIIKILLRCKTSYHQIPSALPLTTRHACDARPKTHHFISIFSTARSDFFRPFLPPLKVLTSAYSTRIYGYTLTQSTPGETNRCSRFLNRFMTAAMTDSELSFLYAYLNVLNRSNDFITVLKLFSFLLHLASGSIWSFVFFTIGGVIFCFCTLYREFEKIT